MQVDPAGAVVYDANLARLKAELRELEEAMELFEQGSALAGRCREMLANAEQRLEELAPAEPEDE